MNMQKIAFIDIYKEKDKFQRVISFHQADISKGSIRLDTGWELEIIKVEARGHSFEVRFDHKKHKSYRQIH